MVLLFALVTMVGFGQDTAGYYNKILTKFKNEVVNASFKDPYSFQLLSLKYYVTKVGEELKNEIKVRKQTQLDVPMKLKYVSMKRL